MDKIDHGIGFLALDWLQWGEKWDEKKAEIALKYMSQLRDELRKSIAQMDEMAKRYAAENSKLRLDLDIAVEALKFYQARSNVPIKEFYNCLNKQISTGHILDEYCKQSREALAKIRGQG